MAVARVWSSSRLLAFLLATRALAMVTVRLSFACFPFRRSSSAFSCSRSSFPGSNSFTVLARKVFVTSRSVSLETSEGDLCTGFVDAHLVRLWQPVSIASDKLASWTSYEYALTQGYSCRNNLHNHAMPPSSSQAAPPRLESSKKALPCASRGIPTVSL